MGNTSSSQEDEIRNPVMQAPVIIGTQGEVMGINQDVRSRDDDDTVYVTERVIGPILNVHSTYIPDDMRYRIAEYVNYNIQENKRQQAHFNRFANKFNKKFQDLQLEYPNIPNPAAALDTLTRIRNTRLQLSNYSNRVDDTPNLTPDMKDSLRKKISKKEGEISKDGKSSWMEVECLGACVNAPILQINDDYFEDLDSEQLEKIINKINKNETPKAGS